MIIEQIIPNAIINEISSPLVSLIIPFNKLPSIKSVKELISGTPGIRNKTDVANPCSSSAAGNKYLKEPAIIVAVNAARNTHK